MSKLFSKAFAPVNIAWIKYMGKLEGRPTNSSLSLTLATLGTFTSMKELEAASELSFEWDREGYQPPPTGQKKAEDFLKNEKLWLPLLKEFGFEAHIPSAKIRIRTNNNVPAGAGIATSASAFAALTLAWSAYLTGERQTEWMELYRSGNPKMRRALAAVAAKGSGSSCRSLDGPWVEWNPDQGISVIDGGETEWMDFIFLVESAPKEVPSSEAHVRVKTSPHFNGRVERAEMRLSSLKSHLKKNAFPEIRKLVLDEAMDMHQLFHTSEPTFRYMTDLSKQIVDRAREVDFNAVVTLDAGANVHVFVPVNEESKCDDWIQKNFPQVNVIKDVTGYGARYE